jgi:hypothetical protein
MSPRASLLAVATLPLLFASRAEAIPFERRLTLRLEANLGYVASPGNPYTAGFLGSARLGLQLFEPLALQVSVTEGVFPSRDVPTSLNTNWTGGLRFEPRTVRPFGRLFIDANAGLSVTGFDSRFGFDAGAGWEFEVSRGFFMGPVVRVSYISTVAIRGPAPQAPQDATYISLGLSMFIQPWPAPRGRAGHAARDQLREPARPGLRRRARRLRPVPRQVVEDHDGYQDEDGCPDLDDDADNLPDSEDRCPRGAETANGYEDEDGCPDELPLGSLRIEWSGGEIRLRQRVYFPVNRVADPAVVLPDPHGAGELPQRAPRDPPRCGWRATPTTAGRAARASRCRYRRAQAVLRFLVEHGVARGAPEPVGFGDLAPTRPRPRRGHPLAQPPHRVRRRRRPLGRRAAAPRGCLDL